jgi:preprotein translocase subunit YajC
MRKDLNGQMYFQHAFFQITFPLMATFVVTMWLASRSRNKRFDEISRMLDEIRRRLERRGGRS